MGSGSFKLKVNQVIFEKGLGKLYILNTFLSNAALFNLIFLTD